MMGRDAMVRDAQLMIIEEGESVIDGEIQDREKFPIWKWSDTPATRLGKLQ